MGRVDKGVSEGVRVINNLSESHLAKIWQHQLWDKAGLVTEGGEVVAIIHPGRINHDQGADFRDAVIAIGQGLRKGDIEIHVKSSDWRAHRHHRDAAYNRVILQVVMWHNTKAAINLENGGEVPVLALHKYLKLPLNQLPHAVGSSTISNMPCRKVIPSLTTGTIARFLDRAGEERFLTKAVRFRVDLAQMEAGQSLYQGIMGALGYSKNKLSMLELARRLPLRTLESVAQGEMSDEECLTRQQLLILGMAGLLPSPCPERYQGNSFDDRWSDKLARRWYSCRGNEVMSPDAWHWFKVRPSNSPLRRLLAMSYLVLRYRRKGLLEGLVSLVREVPVSRGGHRLAEGLLVTADSEQASHFDFASVRGMKSLTLLGRGRASDITVNVLLPFTFAWSQFTSQPELERKAVDLYCRHPKLAVNSVERHMKEQLGLSSALVNSARRQQGLIHIYDTLCTQGKCNCCLSQLEAGHHV